jgi:hypothetical protein
MNFPYTLTPYLSNNNMLPQNEWDVLRAKRLAEVAARKAGTSSQLIKAKRTPPPLNLDQVEYHSRFSEDTTDFDVPEPAAKHRSTQESSRWSSSSYTPKRESTSSSLSKRLSGVSSRLSWQNISPKISKFFGKLLASPTGSPRTSWASDSSHVKKSQDTHRSRHSSSRSHRRPRSGDGRSRRHREDREQQYNEMRTRWGEAYKKASQQHKATQTTPPPPPPPNAGRIHSGGITLEERERRRRTLTYFPVGPNAPSPPADFPLYRTPLPQYAPRLSAAAVRVVVGATNLPTPGPPPTKPLPQAPDVGVAGPSNYDEQVDLSNFDFPDWAEDASSIYSQEPKMHASARKHREIKRIPRKPVPICSDTKPVPVGRDTPASLVIRKKVPSKRRKSAPLPRRF